MTERELNLIRQFVERVNRRAEMIMLSGHKLEGAHRAAMEIEYGVLETMVGQDEEAAGPTVTASGALVYARHD